jgi:hypothetical protein
LCGALFVITGVGAFFAFRGRMFLPLFASGFGVALIICGVWYDRAAKLQID